eukprot:jgi/Astpho2/1315/Aster-06187
MVQLGCPKNTVDGEVMLGDMLRGGLAVTEDHAEADAIVINTCAFVEEAKTESIDAILEAAQQKAQGSNQKIIVHLQSFTVTRCCAEQIPEADLVMGFQNYGNLTSSLQGLLGMEQSEADAHPAKRARVQVGNATVPFRPELERHRLTPRHTAYLRVAEGCNHACTFCAIPGFRGKFRSKPWQDVVTEAKALVASGVKELNLIAEDTNQYGQDWRNGHGLAELMRELGQINGLHWMRILYAYPSYFTDELIEEIASNPKVCKYIDIPLQHISNLTLLSMNRPPQDHTVKLLTKLRDRIPGLVLRTTFIAGFPGETEGNHRELVDFCRQFQFERMGCFTYSEEDGTPAASYPEQVPEEERQARRDELVALQQEVGERFAEGMVGQEVDVLVDSISDDGELIGRTQFDAPDVDPCVFLSESLGMPPLEIGQMRRCQVHGSVLYDLEASPVC